MYGGLVMHIIHHDKDRILNIHALELHKVYQSIKDKNFYVLAKISYDKDKSHYNCLLNLNTMKGRRMCDVIAVNEFVEVAYQFEVRD